MVGINEPIIPSNSISHKLHGRIGAVVQTAKSMTTYADTLALRFDLKGRLVSDSAQPSTAAHTVATAAVSSPPAHSPVAASEFANPSTHPLASPPHAPPSQILCFAWQRIEFEICSRGGHGVSHKHELGCTPRQSGGRPQVGR